MSALPLAWPKDRVSPQVAWRPPAGTRVISVDDHVLEPMHLWEDRLPAADRDRGPKWYRGERDFEMVIDGSPLPWSFTPGLIEGRPGMADQALRLVDMDAEGLDVNFVFPQRAMALFVMQDKELMVRCFDVYNEWLSGWCAQAPDRLYGVGVLPTIYEPEASADYVAKLKALGYRAIQIPSAPHGVYYNSPKLEPLWDAIEASGIPLSFHIGENPDNRGVGQLGTNLTLGFGPFKRLWCILTFAGVLERHPDMNVIFVEGGIGWVPSALHDADKAYRQFEVDMNPKLAHLPSYYWHRQCYATFQDDPVGLRLLDLIGADKALWSSDYPHPESTLGESRGMVRSIFEAVGDEAGKMLVGGNAARLYGLAPA